MRYGRRRRSGSDRLDHREGVDTLGVRPPSRARDRKRGVWDGGDGGVACDVCRSIDVRPRASSGALRVCSTATATRCSSPTVQPSRCPRRYAAYRNADGGFGHALEPDLRCPASQPAPTLYALEVLNEAGAACSEMARDARAWIVSIAEGDGGIPFVLAGFEDFPHAPWWSPQPGFFLTFELAAVLHTSGITDEEGLDRATNWCWRSIETTERPSGYWLKNACGFLDTVPDEQRARAALASLCYSRRSACPRWRRGGRGGVTCPRPFASSR
jgi:hypothetical protein